ncbi:kinase-like domain-containing protein [Rhexocercosporidium sp. MPI-PUGE-AT-0058]|nr:kinase-like domain-containing protein [Rhexocercosporidium sp. MPI-PUGE-AT-0058]
MSLSKSKVIGVGTMCYVTTTDNKSVLKGHQVWFDGSLRLAREETIYKHLGNHSQILTCFGLEEVHSGVYSPRLEMAPLGSIRAYIQKNPNSPPPIRQRLQMALDVAAGVSYVHLRRALLCDLSCTNLFVFDGLRIKLGHFGGALLDGFDFRWDQTHEELFGLGPFPELNDEEVDGKYAREEFPPLDSNVARNVIWNCWAEVYVTAQEVRNDLDQILGKSGYLS